MQVAAADDGLNGEPNSSVGPRSLVWPIVVTLPIVLAAAATIILPSLGGVVTSLREPGEDTVVAALRQLPGTQLNLPAKDRFGRSTAGKTRTIAILPGCNSCSLSEAGAVKIPKLQRADIYITPDSGYEQRLGQLAKSSSGKLRVVVDPYMKVAPKLLFEVAPVLLFIDSQNRVIRGEACR